MHSNYAMNSRCEQGNFCNAPNFPGGNILPTIEEEADFDGTQLLDDIEDLLEGSNSVPLKSMLREEHGRRPRTDLTALMQGGQKLDLLQHTPTIGLRRRLESYLEEELVRTYQEQFENDEQEEKNPDPVTMGPRRKSTVTAQPNSKSNNDESPIVWVIEPGYDRQGTLRFKFSTDGGAYLILKDEEAKESVIIMAESSRNTFFQVYSLQGGVSRVLRSDQISQAIDDIVEEAKPELEEEDEIHASMPETDEKIKKRHGQRFIRYILRRRWKNLVRRQVGIAMEDASKKAAVGDARKKAHGWFVLYPIFLILKMLTRRSRTF
jgi:hypothetical protein